MARRTQGDTGEHSCELDGAKQVKRQKSISTLSPDMLLLNRQVIEYIKSRAKEGLYEKDKNHRFKYLR